MTVLSIHSFNQAEADRVYDAAAEFLSYHYPEAGIDLHKHTVTIITDDPRQVCEDLITDNVLDPHKHDYQVDE